jgi:hypothetical protein
VRRILALAAVLVGLLATGASAKVPHFVLAQPSIVPGISAGGVTIGDTMNEAKVTWGAPDSCTTYRGLTTCAYTTASSIGPQYVAAFFVKRGHVVAIELDSPDNANARKHVRRLRTAKGIHVGSPIATARAKYGIPSTGAGEANESRADLKKGKRCTEFYAPKKPYVTITSITLGICKSVIGLYF